ncbi:MAG: protein kinase [Polyangiaceae bacterium]|jgi:serine/threonine-protein kinase|nr:protein kinase [Polyangiaceae bacterium]
MGEVYEARDKVLSRSVAIKFLLRASAEGTMRLLQEARALARLEHPNLCKVYEAGEPEGKPPYIAMQLVSGRPLSEEASELSLPEKVQVMRQVAEAMHEAHRQGVIHRDLKPANIMLGRTADGRWGATVMDFGLAYEVHRGHALTEIGQVMGTLAYMAPEQARGEVRSIDRRSDIYALGVTLYELLTGQVPFRAPTGPALLQQVFNDEPKPLRVHVPQLPVDLETITLKCLSKEPDRRYATARELGDDLGRYLEGEPIVGRRPGAAERARRWVQKRRALVAVSTISLALILVFAVVGAHAWLEARRARSAAVEQARLAQELGQQAQAIESFLRVAYGAPLHDTIEEQRRVRELMAAIGAREVAGGAGRSLVHYALGRGHLALGEFEPARAELSLARQQDVDSPELNYALGRALGELYQRALSAARGGGSVAWVAARQGEAEAQFLRPALAALERSRGLKVESPFCLEGFIALYRRDYDAASRAAERAIAEAPWVYEARKLAGDVHLARAAEGLERGEYETARAEVDEAIAFYERASEHGRSDAHVYEALAGAWLDRSELDQRLNGPHGQSLAHALTAIDRAVVADPRRASTHTRRAFVLKSRYQLRNQENASEAELEAADEEWEATARRAIDLDPQDAFAYVALGNAFAKRGLRDTRAGRDPTPAWHEAARWLSGALERKPAFPRGLNDLGAVYLSEGNYLANRGVEPRDVFARARHSFDAAIESDPAYMRAYANLSDVATSQASYEVTRGQDPELAVERALAVAERAFALDPRYFATLNQAALAELERAAYLDRVERDARPAVERSFTFIERSLRVNDGSDLAWFYRARGHYLLARQAQREGGEPRASLVAAERALDEAYRRDSTCPDCRVLGSQLNQLEATLAGHATAGAVSLFRRALAETKKAFERYPAYAEAYQEAARVSLRLAEASPGDAPAAIDEGLSHADRALALAPGVAEARAIRGALLLARARALRDAARLEAARLAVVELEHAFALNPLLAHDYGAHLRDARAF